MRNTQDYCLKNFALTVTTTAPTEKDRASYTHDTQAVIALGPDAYILSNFGTYSIVLLIELNCDHTCAMSASVLWVLCTYSRLKCLLNLLKLLIVKNSPLLMYPWIQLGWPHAPSYKVVEILSESCIFVVLSQIDPCYCDRSDCSICYEYDLKYFEITNALYMVIWFSERIYWACEVAAKQRKMLMSRPKVKSVSW